MPGTGDASATLFTASRTCGTAPAAGSPRRKARAGRRSPPGSNAHAEPDTPATSDPPAASARWASVPPARACRRAGKGECLSRSRAKQLSQPAKRPMDTRQDRRVADGRAPAFGGTKGAYELAKCGEVVCFVSDDEILVIQAERVGQQLAYLRVPVADLHVLVHDALPGLLVEQIPISRLRERINDQIPRPLAAEQGLLLWRRLLHILGGLDQPQEALRHAHPRPHSAAQGGGRRFFEGLQRGGKAP